MGVKPSNYDLLGYYMENECLFLYIFRRISGLGATGSFQLVDKFHPSPSTLAGQDTESDYEEEIQAEAESKGTTPGGRGAVFTEEMFKDAYVPRPSKSRGHGRKGTNIEKSVSP